jgi:hypothetical protein
MLGLGYGCIAVTRLFSIIADQSTERSNIISVVSEVLFGAILLV